MVGHARARRVAGEVGIRVLAVAEHVVQFGAAQRVLVVHAVPTGPVVVGLVHRAGTGVAPARAGAERAEVPGPQTGGDVRVAALPDVEVEVPADDDRGVGGDPLVDQLGCRVGLGGGRRLGGGGRGGRAGGIRDVT